MNDPRRALGREDNIRIDAQLLQNTISSGSPIGITYQVQNLGNSAVAIADKTTVASYDADSQTITISIGSEVPQNGTMPHVVLINAGEKKVLTTAATAYVNTPDQRTPWTVAPRFVQVKVNVLRDLAPFRMLIETQAQRASSAAVLTDEQFDRWLDGNDAIFLNSIPVRWVARQRTGAELATADMRGTF